MLAPVQRAVKVKAGRLAKPGVITHGLCKRKGDVILNDQVCCFNYEA
jgi:hypothetical protein